MPHQQTSLLCEVYCQLMSVVHCCVGGSRYGGYGDRPPNASSGMVKPPYGGGRNDGYSAPSYGSYGSMFQLTNLSCHHCFL